MAFPTGWTSKLHIKSDNTKVSGSTNLTDYPVLIADGNLTSAVYAGLHSTGKDLRITTDSAGTTEIPFEIVALDTSAETSEIWAKVPTLNYATDTSLYIWYGNASAVAYGASDTYGRNAVWSDYVSVWHMNETGGSRIDSSANEYNLSDINTVLSGTGKIGTGADFEATNSEYLSITDASAPNLEMLGSQTYQAWIKGESFEAVTQNQVMGKAPPGLAQYRLVDIYQTKPRVQISGLSGGSLTSATTLSTGTFYKLTFRYDASANTLALFIGSTKESKSVTGTPTDTNDRFDIGLSGTAASNYFDGIIDDVRVRASAISDDWITTEYNNQNSPSTFWSIASSRRIFMIT